MPWVVGIDEAGYGPNLGPLLQAAVAVKLPASDVAGWDTLKPHVRRHTDRDKTRTLVDDSKLVHSGKNGLQKLEQGLVALLGLSATTLGDWLNRIALEHVVNDLQAEAWYDSTLSLPLFPNPPADLRSTLLTLNIETQIVGVNLVTTPVFNRIVHGSESKATVLSIGLSNLLATLQHGLSGDDKIHVYCDKQGGRNFYGPLLQGAFPEGWVVTEHESATESRYRIENLGRNVSIIFRPRADSGSISVALASMLCKYLREVCMLQFNKYWQCHLPSLKSTAGYPVDAKRFIAEIRPLLGKVGLVEDLVWRVR